MMSIRLPWRVGLVLFLGALISAQAETPSNAKGVMSKIATQLQLPSFASFRQGWQSSDAILLDRNGVAIGSKRVDAQARRLAWVGLDEVSPAFVRALLSAEDKRFYEHTGVDWLAVSSAVWRNWMGNAKAQRGASSISMQVAALLATDLQRPKGGRDWSQKWDQMQAALELEKAWSKVQILEAYFNSVFYRGELQGISAASWGLFGKSPSGLDQLESAVLVALIRKPNAKPALVAQRACDLLATSPCDKDLVQIWLQSVRNQPPAIAALAPHAAQRLLRTQPLAGEISTQSKSESATGLKTIDARSGETTIAGGAAHLQFRSSLDVTLQRAALQALRDQLATLRGERVRDGAVVVLDNRSGAVLAYVGSSGVFSESPEVDAATAPRQVGSVIKPLLYALAFDRGLLSPGSLLDDVPLSLPTAAGLYTPQNYDQQFIGPVSVRKALASSLNIPAVQTIGLTTVGAFHRQLKNLGFKGLHPDPEHYGFALALGAADLQLLEMTNAYRSLANGGRYSEIHWDAGSLMANASQGRRVYSEESAWQIASILSDNRARSHTFGLDSVLATPFWTAVKTGTSKDMRDNWCIGFSQHYTVGVWIGNAEGEPMHQVSGVTGAAPVWAQVMQFLHVAQSSKPKPAPKGLIAREIHFEQQLEPGRLEWFNAFQRPDTTTPVLVRLSQEAGEGKIIYPLNDSLIAWDPDIPTAMQGIVPKHSVAVEASHHKASQTPLRWVFNGQAQSGQQPLLRFQPGVNELRLEKANGELLDQVRFVVRGMPAVTKF